MSHIVSSIWKSLPKDIFSRLEDCINILPKPVSQSGDIFLFFRADDVAVPSENFSRLLSLFYKYQIPLSLAVVPAWLTHQRWDQLRTLTDYISSLWCWHQHGWRHVNHSEKGKKHEFGRSRSSSQIKTDLKNGMDRLKNIMGENFYPVFTPPWNRCDNTTLDQLKSLKFMAISRSSGNNPKKILEIAEYNVNVDLHTRKERDPEKGWDNLFEELNQAFEKGICGVMIHHQLMNDHAFVFIETLFQFLAHNSNMKTVNLKYLAENNIAAKRFD
jgi:peptidoglycan/xylan/chitin deacetylase (PgdA/CDA1 family)